MSRPMIRRPEEPDRAAAWDLLWRRLLDPPHRNGSPKPVKEAADELR